jgi:hypothetical protein
VCIDRLVAANDLCFFTALHILEMMLNDASSPCITY